MRKWIALFLVCMLVMVLFAGCEEEDKQDPKEELIQSLLEDVYDISEEDYKTYSGWNITSDSGYAKMDQWLLDRFGGYFTEDGYAIAMQNRVLLQGFTQYVNNGNEPAKITDLQLEKKESGGETWYEYTVTLDTQAPDNVSSGKIFLTDKTPWRVEKITK